MFNKFDVMLSIYPLLIVIIMGFSTVEIKNNSLENNLSELSEEIVPQFLSQSDEQPPVPYKEGTSRG